LVFYLQGAIQYRSTVMADIMVDLPSVVKLLGYILIPMWDLLFSAWRCISAPHGNTVQLTDREVSGCVLLSVYLYILSEAFRVRIMNIIG
jgi:hypothetical protein